jgi:YD repeat-containing protein
VLPAHAAETEVRRFNVSVDGKQSGQYTMTFTNQDDGTLAIACDAHVKVKVAFVTAYHYDYTGTEVWKDGRLLSLKSTCDDDGKKFQVNAVAGESGLTVTVNGSRRTVRWDVFLTTACCWPDAKRRDGDLPLMESDNAQEINGKIQHIADDTTGSHYRLTSLCQHEIWYDAAGRMVRQEWTEGGHKSVLELAK